MAHENVNTPWGRSQSGDEIVPGMVFYHTAGHGGIKVVADLNKKIPAAFRTQNGWYEEDCKASIPMHFLKAIILDHNAGQPRFGGWSCPVETFYEEYGDGLVKSLKSWEKAAYHVHFGVQFPVEEIEEAYQWCGGMAAFNAEVAEVKKRIATIAKPSPSPRAGDRIRFKETLKFTNGASYQEFDLVRHGKKAIRFKPMGTGLLVQITNWRRMSYEFVDQH